MVNIFARERHKDAKTFSSARFVAAGRLRAGTLIGASAADVPSESRFFAGGGGSVRGYGFQAIGPIDDEGTPLGGRSLLDAAVEGRWRYNDTIGVVAFIDAGGHYSYPYFNPFGYGASCYAV